jgi:hypothetical protein
MPEPKPRRSIFDTLKKSADGRLGLAEAARMADKISVFPTKRVDPTTEPTFDPTHAPTHDPSLDPTHDLTQRLDHDPTPVATPVPTQVPTGVVSPVPTPVPTYGPTGDPTHDLTLPIEPTTEPTPDPTIKTVIRGLPPNKRRFLHFIIDHEPAGDDYIVSRRFVAKALQLTEISVKRYFAEFAELGFFRKETYRHGVCQGVRLFLVRSRCQAFKQYEPTLDPTEAPTIRSDPTPEPTADPTPDPTIYKVERKKELLSFSPARIALTWPNLARAGFGRDQLEQIEQALTELGKPTDKITTSLDHAEWELEHGVMRDKDGQTVADPCSWVFRSLARTGYYRRPKGYVSPEEQAAKDAEDEAKAVIAARQAADQARFEAWKAGLDEQALDEAMRGHPGGSRDAWLKKIWRERAAAPCQGKA